MSKENKVQLSVTDLNNYRRDQTIPYAVESATGKEMRLTFYGGIQVWKDGKLIKEFIQEYQAVEFFNSL